MIPIVATMVVGVAILLLLPVGDSVMGEKLLLEFRAKSFQGRADIYYESLHQLGERPILGWGTQEMASRAGWTYPPSGHPQRVAQHGLPFWAIGAYGVPRDRWDSLSSGMLTESVTLEEPTTSQSAST